MALHIQCNLETVDNVKRRLEIAMLSPAIPISAEAGGTLNHTVQALGQTYDSDTVA